MTRALRISLNSERVSALKDAMSGDVVGTFTVTGSRERLNEQGTLESQGEKSLNEVRP